MRRAQALSPGTIEKDEHNVGRFIGWVADERPKLRALLEIDAATLEAYAIWLATYETEEGSRLQASTRQGTLASLKPFFRWLEKRGDLFLDPSRDLALPKVPKRLPRGVLSTKEVTQVLAVPDVATPLGRRDRVILEILYSTGIRNTELRALKLEDLNLTESLIAVKEGKGRKDRVVPLGRIAQRQLERYLEEVRPTLVRSRHERHVLLSKYGLALSKAQLIRIMERTGKQAGLGKPLTCHGLRHTCATHMLRGGADIRQIQELLGHKTLGATELYTHVAISDLKRIHARCHPRERGK